MVPRRSLLVLLVFVFSSQFCFGQASGSDYQAFLQSYQSGLWEDAATYINGLYQDFPDEELYTYWYGITHYHLQDYPRAAEALSRLDASYYPYPARFYLSESRYALEDYSGALTALEEALAEEHTPETARFFRLLIIWCDELGLYELLGEHVGQMVAYFSEYPAQASWYLGRSARILFERALYSIASDRSDKALVFLNQCREAASGSEPLTYPNPGLLNLIENVVLFWEANQDLLARAYDHRFCIIVFDSMNAEGVGENGERVRVSNTFDRDLMADFDLQFSFFSKLLFYYTQGRMAASLIYEFTDADIQGIETFTWTGAEYTGRAVETIDVQLFDYQSASEWPTDIIFRHRNDTDTFIFTAPTEGFHASSAAKFGRLVFIPGRLWGEVRGRIILSSQALSGYFNLMHEFFHNIEAAYDTGNECLTRHVFREGYEEFWPDWYTGGSELEYYDAAFRNYLLPRGLYPMFFRSVLDTTDPARFEVMGEE